MKIAVLVDGLPEGGAGPEESASRAGALLREAGHEVLELPLSAQLVSSLRAERPDVCFIAARGARAEEGSLQDALEFLGIPFAGASADACRRVWNRANLAGTMDAWRNASGGESLAAAWYRPIVITRRGYGDLGAQDALDLVEDRIPGGYPVCVRAAGAAGPATRASDAGELQAAVDAVLAQDETALIHEWPEGVELAVGVLGQGWNAYALPPAELDAQGRAAVAPVRLESLSGDQASAQAVRSEIERAALDAYQAHDMNGYGEVHLIWDGAQARILGLRAVPDLSEGSAFAASCEAAGLTLAAVLNALVGA